MSSDTELGPLYDLTIDLEGKVTYERCLADLSAARSNIPPVMVLELLESLGEGERELRKAQTHLLIGAGYVRVAYRRGDRLRRFMWHERDRRVLPRLASVERRVLKVLRVRLRRV